MRSFNVSYQRDAGYQVILVEGVPWWRRAVENVWEFLCWVTQGTIAGHGCPEWMWKIPVGKPKYDHDEDGRFLTNSVAGKLWTLENYILGTVADHRPYEVAVVPISVEVARQLAPEMVEMFEEDE